MLIKMWYSIKLFKDLKRILMFDRNKIIAIPFFLIKVQLNYIRLKNSSSVLNL